MKKSGIMAIILVSGTFLWGGAVFADPDRHSDRGRKFEQHWKSCEGNRDCRPGNRVNRRDREDDRYRYTDTRRREWNPERDYDRNRTSIQLRISTYPVSIDTDRYRYSRYNYRPYYYRDYRLNTYPYRTPDYRTGRNTIYWINENDRDYAPLQTSQSNDGRYCREYYTEAEVQGRIQQVYGTACMQPDGSWQIIN